MWGTTAEPLCSVLFSVPNKLHYSPHSWLFPNSLKSAAFEQNSIAVKKERKKKKKMKGTVAIFHTFSVDIRALVLSFLPKPLTAPHAVQPHISIFFEIWNSKYYFCTAQRFLSNPLWWHWTSTRPERVCLLLHHPSSWRFIYTFSSPLHLCCIWSLALSRGLGPLPDLIVSTSPLDVLQCRNNAEYNIPSCMAHLHKPRDLDEGNL